MTPRSVVARSTQEFYEVRDGLSVAGEVIEGPREAVGRRAVMRLDEAALAGLLATLAIHWPDAVQGISSTLISCDTAAGKGPIGYQRQTFGTPAGYRRVRSLQIAAANLFTHEIERKEGQRA